MRRQLHRWFLAAPFAHRAYQKPLGYAGDYELVNMMARNEIEGGSLFAKVVNAWFLAQAPAEAHRKRLDYLLKTLKLETLRVVSSGQRARIFNVACGPAIEIQRFLAQEHLSSETSISLLDFDQETLDYARAAIERARGGNNRAASLHFIRKSVQTLLKESGRTTIRSPADQYDLVYCAGLFDYLSDAVCQRLLGLMYEWLAPGGLLVATNVEPSNPLRHGMEHLLDWHLVYRTAPELLALKPPPAPDHAARVWADDATLVNIWLEVRKPKNG
jgi:extracellular factor (EF) 3-hydroxypalmitic acid methyl ester biosynthesis protein